MFLTDNHHFATFFGRLAHCEELLRARKQQTAVVAEAASAKKKAVRLQAELVKKKGKGGSTGNTAEIAALRAENQTRLKAVQKADKTQTRLEGELQEAEENQKRMKGQLQEAELRKSGRVTDILANAAENQKKLDEARVAARKREDDMRTATQTREDDARAASQKREDDARAAAQKREDDLRTTAQARVEQSQLLFQKFSLHQVGVLQQQQQQEQAARYYTNAGQQAPTEVTQMFYSLKSATDILAPPLAPQPIPQLEMLSPPTGLPQITYDPQGTTHSLYLSLSHTHTLSLSISLSPPLDPSFSLSLFSFFLPLSLYIYLLSLSIH